MDTKPQVIGLVLVSNSKHFVLFTKKKPFRKAFPDQATFINESESYLIKHLFAISNLGKSPFDVHAILAVPVSISAVSVITVQNVEATRNNEASYVCSLVTENENLNLADYLLHVVENGSEVVTCGVDSVDCELYSCDIGHLSTSSQVATVSMKIMVKPVLYGK